MAQQYKLDDIKIQEPTENKWSSPINWKFGVVNARSQISLTDVKDTSSNPVNASTYGNLTRADLYWLVQRQGLKLANHALYFEISEGRDSNTKNACNSLETDYFATGSGIELSGDKALLGIDPIVLDREKGVIRYTHAALVLRTNSYGDRQNFLDENSWFNIQGRRLNYPIGLYESREDALKIVDVLSILYNNIDPVSRFHDHIDASAGRHPFCDLDWNARLMRNLEVEIEKKTKAD